MMNSTTPNYPWYAYKFPDKRKMQLALYLYSMMPTVLRGVEQLRSLYEQYQTEQRLNTISRIKNATKVTFNSVSNTFEIYSTIIDTYAIRMFHFKGFTENISSTEFVRLRDDITSPSQLASAYKAYLTGLNKSTLNNNVWR